MLPPLPEDGSMARIPLPTRESLTDEALQRRWDRLAERGPVLNVFRLFLTNPAIELNAFQVWEASGLTPRQREIVILRCAVVRQSTYEWHQHVRIAAGAGLTPAEIDAVRAWRDSTAFSEDERALLAYVDELAASPRPSDAAFDAVARDRSPGEVLGVTMLITLDFQLAHVMAALDLETEEPFVGWEAGSRQA
jgi:4-carboxymuconolactone decarboxylase